MHSSEKVGKTTCKITVVKRRMGENGHHYHHLYLIFELVEEGDVVIRGNFLALPEHKMTMRIRMTNYDKKCDN